jgi:hypothetical protein
MIELMLSLVNDWSWCPLNLLIHTPNDTPLHTSDDPVSWVWCSSSEACRSGQSLCGNRLKVIVENKSMLVAPLSVVGSAVAAVRAHTLRTVLSLTRFISLYGHQQFLIITAIRRAALPQREQYYLQLLSLLRRQKNWRFLLLFGPSSADFDCLYRSTLVLSNCRSRLVKRPRV